MIVPESLRDPAMAAVWEAVRFRLESRGTGNRGRIRLPAVESKGARLALGGLMGRPQTSTLDLAALERALVDRGIGADLTAALDALGFAVSPVPARRREEQQNRARVRAAAQDSVTAWPEPWAPQWIDDVVRSGLLKMFDEAGAAVFVGSVLWVLDRLTSSARSAPISRTELAASLFGSAHALDRGTPLGAACARALALAFEDQPDMSDATDVWERAGAHADLVSGPALVWALPVSGDSPIARMSSAATELGAPFHTTQLALRACPLAVPTGTVVLVTENPRVVEAAAQRRTLVPVMTTNGNPSAAVRLLLDQLLGCGAHLRYHGDFDVAGLAICARMFRLGLQPWRMSVTDYLEAIDTARKDGIVLPVDEAPPGPTPWDPDLRAVFRQHRLIVHEERLLDELLG